MSTLFYCILLLTLSFIAAVPLDGACTQASQCEGTGVICEKDKCQCNALWYTPCQASCEVRRRFAYEGEACEVTENCVDNMRCLDKRCGCVEPYVARNGLCYKNLNAACTNSSECWSNYCTSSRCACPSGYEPREDNSGCRRKLVNIYATWNEANQASDFCSDRTSCVDIVALCFNDTANPSATFCRCPYGYKVVSDNKRCEPIESPHFSPLDTQPSRYEECGTCKDGNAVCINAAEQITCWCRATYIKSGDQCVQRPTPRETVIFPTQADRSIHDFTSKCATGSNATEQVQNSLCTCASGYQFVAAKQACERILTEWNGEALEYGLCTRITSRDTAAPESGLCPLPLQCRARKDKYVCSCGENRFRDIDDPSKCVYFIGKQAPTAADSCPTSNAQRNTTSGVCQCLPGFGVANLNRQCEAKLATDPFQPTCSSDRSNDKICTGRYGRRSLLCSPGECRCSGNGSFANTERTQCYAPVETTLPTPLEYCPPNSALSGNTRCNCIAGYRASADLRSCVRLQALLSGYVGVPLNNMADNFKTDDCTALYTGPVEAYNSLRCQCKTGTQPNTDNNGCWYLLSATVSSVEDVAFCPPNSTALLSRRCECDVGFTARNDRCVRITELVYVDADPSAPNITGLTEGACSKWFGTGSTVSSRGLYCTCKNSSYFVSSTSNCRFLINVETADIKGVCTCPDNTNVTTSGSRSTCVCKPGYRVSAINRTCEPSNIALVGTEMRSASTFNCVNYTNVDCTAKFGDDAFCRNERCYCDRTSSYIGRDRRCEPFSGYTFPAVHELQSYACANTEDCGGKENVECADVMDRSNQKVCKCTKDAYLDVQSKTCVKQRCQPGCNTGQNLECRGYECVCKDGFYPSDSRCLPITNKLELGQPCNNSIEWVVAANNETNLVCDLNCNRARCAPGYQPKESTCAALALGSDRCVYREDACKIIDANSICDRDENQCLCAPSFYLAENHQCARAVDSVCATDEDCGGSMSCEGQRCKCSSKQRAEATTDIYSRPITRCFNNGVGQLRFSAMLVVLLACFRAFLL